MPSGRPVQHKMNEHPWMISEPPATTTLVCPHTTLEQRTGSSIFAICGKFGTVTGLGSIPTITTPYPRGKIWFYTSRRKNVRMIIIFKGARSSLETLPSGLTKMNRYKWRWHSLIKVSQLPNMDRMPAKSGFARMLVIMMTDPWN